MTMSFTSEVTIRPNATPSTIPAAMSIRFPRSANSLNSLSIAASPCLCAPPIGGRAGILRSRHYCPFVARSARYGAAEGPWPRAGTDAVGGVPGPVPAAGGVDAFAGGQAGDAGAASGAGAKGLTAST